MAKRHDHIAQQRRLLPKGISRKRDGETVLPQAKRQEPDYDSMILRDEDRFLLSEVDANACSKLHPP